LDDIETFLAKVASMNWKLIGDKTLLMPQTYYTKKILKINRDGSYDAIKTDMKFGYMEKNWQGASWVPLNIVWAPRPVWVIEQTPKDTYYNYGRQIIYMDKDGYLGYFKVIHDRSGAYWKTLISSFTYAFLEDGESTCVHQDYCSAIDDRGKHCTYTAAEYKNGQQSIYKARVPMADLGPEHFTESYMRQLSK